MKPSTYFAAAIACFCYFLPLQADAARCPSGYICRPSAHVCQSKAAAQRAGVYRARHAKASIRYRSKKAKPAKPSRVMRAAGPATVVAEAAPAPAVSPMHYSREPNRIAYGPFGELLPMPETPVSWALRNGVVQ